MSYLFLSICTGLSPLAETPSRMLFYSILKTKSKALPSLALFFLQKGNLARGTRATEQLSW